MKLVNILTHPLLLITSFLFILISGEHFGGFYLVYLLLALPHGGIHALLGFLGISLLVFSYVKFKRANKAFIEPALNFLGVCCMLLSLFFFFYRDKQGYNEGTFEQVVPQITLALFVVLTIFFIVKNSTRPSGNNLKNATSEFMHVR